MSYNFTVQPNRFPRSVPPRRAPDEVHEAAEKAWADAFRAAAGMGECVPVQVPYLGPAIDAAYQAGLDAKTKNVMKSYDNSCYYCRSGRCEEH